ncbi:MAG: uracil-DNA glycosylase, partial [Bacilli bacterium]|nr:uracil-DNA glycosylase [Bacilli bacterium]
MDKTWIEIINNSYLKEKLNNILNILKDEYQLKDIYPSFDNMFKALNLTSFNDVKVVIIGQDPYHGEGEANGLAFSLNNGVRITPSLRNIFKELENDLNIKKDSNDLTGWAKQGVLLLNAILTVEKDKPLSHKDLGWEEITDYIIKYISDNKNNVPYWPYNKENYTHGRLFAIWQVVVSVNEDFDGLVEIDFCDFEVLHYDECKTGDDMLSFMKEYLSGKNILVEDPFGTSASRELISQFKNEALSLMDDKLVFSRRASG